MLRATPQPQRHLHQSRSEAGPFSGDWCVGDSRCRGTPRDPMTQKGHTRAAASMRNPGQRGDWCGDPPLPWGPPETTDRMSSTSTSWPPRIGFSISGLVCVSPSYCLSSTYTQITNMLKSANNHQCKREPMNRTGNVACQKEQLCIRDLCSAEPSGHAKVQLKSGGVPCIG